uniref:Uncharacterized protein n=1 Tax=Arundo donax TaxID=35708 RepID=A0A0A9CMK6_ARUDO
MATTDQTVMGDRPAPSKSFWKRGGRRGWKDVRPGSARERWTEKRGAGVGGGCTGK